MGAKLLEKHFTLNKFMKGPDSEVSLSPSDMKTLVKGIRIIDQAKGSGIKEVQKKEEQVRDWAHHSVVSIESIKEGEKLTRKNINVKRPGTGIPASELDLLFGKTALKFIPKDSILSRSDFK